MKTLIKTIFMFTLSLSAFAKPVIMVSYYDVFGNAKFNNSQRVALALAQSLARESAFEISLCALPTSFDRAYGNVENCLQRLGQQPTMYLGLGEFGCNMKMETMGRNLDKNLVSPDNDGALKNSAVIENAPKIVAFNHPASEMYCSIPPQARGNVIVSNNAGSFVCNSTAYKFASYYPEVPAGFIHVPSNNCKNIDALTAEAVSNLTAMIRQAMSTLIASHDESPRLPLTKKEIQPLRNNKSDSCRSEFFKRMKASDEGGLFSVLGAD